MLHHFTVLTQDVCWYDMCLCQHMSMSFGKVYDRHSLKIDKSMCGPISIVQVVRELHVINWSDAEVERVPYRSITDYVVSSTKPRSCHHGIFGDDVLRSRMVAARYSFFTEQSVFVCRCQCLLDDSLRRSSSCSMHAVLVKSFKCCIAGPW